jgi:predicted RNase H-like HicB family nuclease
MVFGKRFLLVDIAPRAVYFLSINPAFSLTALDTKRQTVWKIEGLKMHSLDIKVEIFKEDDLYIALCPALNVSSYGETEQDAKDSLIEAIEAFIEECDKMGTLDNHSCSSRKTHQDI